MKTKNKSFKRLFAFLVALVMVTALVPSVIFAADPTFTDVKPTDDFYENIESLYAAGVVTGYGDTGEFRAKNNLNRQEAATMIARALGIEKPTEGFETELKDLDDASAWAVPYIEALEEIKVVKGWGDTGEFRPLDNITRGHVAVMLVRAYGLTEGSVEVELIDIDDYSDKESVEILASNGIVKGFGSTDEFRPNTLVTRGQFAKMVDESMKLELQIVAVRAIGAKEIEVEFNRAIDTAKAEISLKKGSVTTNVEKVTFSEDKKSAVLLTTTKLTATTATNLYYVTVKGLTEEPLLASFAVEAERVAAINVLTETAPMKDDADNKHIAIVNYEVLNQYGEDVTSVYTNINWTASTGWSGTGNVNGELEVTNAASATFIPGAKVYLTGVYADTATGNTAVANAEVTIGLPAKADKVVFEGIYQAAGKEFTANFKNNDNFRLYYSVLDQYGNKMSVTGTPGIVLANSNPLLLAVDFASASVTVDGVEYFAIKIDRAMYTDKGGAAKITAISQTTGTQASYEISLEALSALKTFTLLAPSDMVAVGETIEIPFTALDQNGNVLTKFADLNGKVDLSSSLGFVETADGSAKLLYSDATPGLVILTSFVTDGGNFSTITLDVKAKAVPQVIIGIDPLVSLNVSFGGSLSIEPDDLVYQDQYGREMDNDDLDFGTDTFVKCKTTINSVVSSWTTFYTSYNLYADKLTKLEFALFETEADASPITGSNRVFNVTVSAQAAFKSYEVGDPGVMYNDGIIGQETDAAYNKTLKVYGVKEDGTKVLLANSYYTVAGQTVSKLSVTDIGVISDVDTGGYAAADFKDKDGNAITLKETVTVTVKDLAVDGAIKAVLTQDIELSNAAPTGTTILMKTGVVSGRYQVKATSDYDINGLAEVAVLVVKDQYGAVLAASAGPAIKNVTKVEGSTFKIDNNEIKGAKAGDTFTAELVYGAKVVEVDFRVIAD